MSLIDDFNQQEQKPPVAQPVQQPPTEQQPAFANPPSLGQQTKFAIQHPLQNIQNMWKSHVAMPLAQTGEVAGSQGLYTALGTPAANNMMGQGLTSFVKPEMMALAGLNVAGKILPSLGKLGVFSKLTDYFGSSSALHSAFDRFENTTGAIDYEAHQAWQSVSKGLNGIELSRLAHMIQHPQSELLPTMKESEALHAYKLLLKPYQDLAVKEKIIPEATENYLKQIYKGKLDELNTYATTIPGQKKKPFETYVEAEKFFQEQRDLVKSKGLAEDQVLKMSPTQLEQNGLDPRINRWLQMKPIYDPGLSLAATIRSIKQTLNTRQLMTDLSDLTDKQGRHIFEPDGHGNDNYVRMDLPGKMLEKYIAIASKKTPSGRRTTLVNKPVTVLKEFAPKIERLLHPTSPQSMVSSAAHELSSIVKQGIFYNPLVHTVNELSATLSQTRGNIPAALGMAFKGSRIAQDEAMMKEAISNGLLTKNAQDASVALRKAFQEIPAKMNVPVLTALRSKMSTFNDKTLWTYVNNLSLGLYDYNKNRLLKSGIHPDQACRMAAEVTNTALGNISQRHLNEMISSKDFWEAATMIPKWIATQSKPWLTQIMPNQMLQGFSKPEQDVIKREFFLHLSSGLIQRDMYNNLLNKVMSGHWSWQNSPDNIEKDRIETNMRDAKGQQVTIDTGLFKNISLPKRVLNNPQRFLHPFIKAGISAIAKKDIDTGKTFYSKTDAIKSLFQDFNILGTGELTKNLRDHSILNSLSRSISPVKEFPHIPGGPGAVKLIRLNDSLNPKGKVQYPEDPQHQEIDKFLEKGDHKGLVQYAIQNKVSQEKLDHRIDAFVHPVSYHLKQIPRSVLYSGFSHLSKSDQDQLIAKLKEEGSPYATTLEPYRIGYKAK